MSTTPYSGDSTEELTKEEKDTVSKPCSGDLAHESTAEDETAINLMTATDRRKSSGSSSDGAKQKRERHKSGAPSYADLISQAILSNVHHQLSLAEIYDWLALNVACLHAQRYVHSSKGWKNAVRHTLSVHPRFRKIARMGRPSLWTVVDQDACQQIEAGVNISWKSQHVDESNASNECSDLQFELMSVRSRSNSDPTYRLQRVDPGQQAATVQPEISGSESRLAGLTGVQSIAVVGDDGQTLNVKVSGPIRYLEVTMVDGFTQTTDQEQPSSSASTVEQNFDFSFDDWPRYEVFSDWSE